MSESSDVLLLARLQFAFTISAHIIFPAISIGLASYLAVLEGLWLRTGKLVYRELFFFWSKIFAVGFGMGVVSGVVMSYEFGANWAGFSRVAGSVNGRSPGASADWRRASRRTGGTGRPCRDSSRGHGRSRRRGHCRASRNRP